MRIIIETLKNASIFKLVCFITGLALLILAIVLCTINGHIICIKYGIIYDTFNPSERIVEDVWLVK